MQTGKRISIFTVAMALLSIWSVRAVAMMGAEGPPPCESQACFVEAVSTCKAEASYMTSTAAGASVQYMIEGTTKDGNCKLGMIYMQHPKSGWTYKPLHFVLDPEGDIETRLKEAVADCLAGRTDNNYQCSGPLLDKAGAGGE